MAKRVLIVDDDPAQRRILEETIKRLGFETKTAHRASRPCRSSTVRSAPPSPSCCSISSCPASTAWGPGAARRQAWHSARSSCRRRNGSIDAAINAMRAGAVDFVVKPASPERLEVSIKSALKIEALAGEITRIKKKAEGTLTFDDLVMRGDAMARVIALGRRAAASNIPVLIEGESGRRQGADRARHPGRERARARSRSSPSTAAPSRKTSSRASCSATRRARSPAPSTSASASSRRPTAARCSSTRSASCRSTRR